MVKGLKTKLVVAGLGVAMLGFASTAEAGSEDFESFASGATVTVIGGGEATISRAGNTVIAVSAPLNPDFSGSRSAQGNTFTSANPYRVDFNVMVNSFSVVIGDGGGDLDNLFLDAYDSSNNLLGGVTDILPAGVNAGKTLVISLLSKIDYVLFGSSSNDQFPNSVFIDNLVWSAKGVAVPVPAAAWMALPLLGGLGVIARRKSGPRK